MCEQEKGDKDECFPYRASLVTQLVKNLPVMHPEDPLEKQMATHSSILAWSIPWTEEAHGLQSIGSQRVGHE